MPRFPKKEAEIVALADLIKTGLQSSLAVFPAPPVHRMLLNAKRNQFITARNGAMSASAAAQTAVAEKDDALSALVDAMKSDLRYAETAVDFDDDKLKLIGWSGRKAPAPLAICGQVRLLEAPKQGEAGAGGGGWVFLDWKKPADGGKPDVYTVQRRSPDDDAGGWKTAATAIETQATLVNQPRGEQLEYRVIAINKAGEGTESNTVSVVL